MNKWIVYYTGLAIGRNAAGDIVIYSQMGE